MADEVPICDVLCEAMEYLSKLGSNLRTRSDTFKEKRIKKDKLKNTHAVQKAAKKVLLICELSKKSLEHVESGVKRILTRVGASQAPMSDGGKSSTADKKSPEKKTFHYFEYRKKKLKIAKKVPIKHYMSVRVLARGLPKSVEDLYSVYYDCKLYRQRKRQAIKKKIQKIRSERQSSARDSSVGTEKRQSENESRQKKSDSESEIEKRQIKDRHSSHMSDNDAKQEEADCGSKLSKEGLEKKIVSDDDSSESMRKDKGDSKKVNLQKETRTENDIESQKEDKDKISASDSDETHNNTRKSEKVNLKCNDSVIESEKDKKDKISVSDSDESLSNKIKIKKFKRSFILSSSDSDTPKEEPVKPMLNKASRKEYSLNSNSYQKSTDNVEKENGKLKAGSRNFRLTSNETEDLNIVSDNSNETETENTKINSESDKVSKEKRERKLSARKASPHSSTDSVKNLSEKSASKKEHRKDSDSYKKTNAECKENKKHRYNNKKPTKKSKCDSDSKEKPCESEKSKDNDNIIDLDDEKKSESNNSDSALHKHVDGSKSKSGFDSNDEDSKESLKENNEEFECQKSDHDDQNENVRKNNKMSKSMKVIVTDGDKQNTSDNSEKSGSKKVVDSDEDNKNDSENQKPLLKLVNINKLLKPDILQKAEHTNKPQNIKQYKNNRLAIKSLSMNEKVQRKISKEVGYEDEEEFWVQKRKEVKAFVPKKLTINIIRLPKLSADLLYKHNLRKITQNGSVICGVTENNVIPSEDAPMMNDCDKAGTQTETIQLPDMNTVKSVLLIDSDSDKSESNLDDSNKSKSLPNKNLADETENIKNTLLNESDSDKNEEQQQNKDRADEDQNHDKNYDLSKEPSMVNDCNKLPDTTKTQNLVENTADTDSELCESNNKTPDKEDNPSNESPDKIKSSLLNDSSSGSPKAPSIKKRKHSDSTPQSKRKHIMESMHAKKMLLTYSSSSETEDEQLNSVLKNIKDSLLKGISFDEENDLMKKCRKKLLSSSDSEDDILKRVKKKRKIQSKCPSPENENEATNEKRHEETNEEAVKETSIDQVDGTVDEISNASSSKMGRTREKQGNSSSHNSDSQDDKDIDGLTNLKSLIKTRRRRESSADKETKGSKKKMPSTGLITGEGLLEIPISSDDSSEADNDDVEDEDLPTITLSGLNGGGIGHLAKDELLDDSDSSKSSEDAKNDDESDDEEDVKRKRRKAANAISSDSEAGSSRRKADPDVKISDFEDSEDEGSDSVKKNKRKKKGSDSDASGGSSNEGNKKKRRRIKEIESDASGSDTENEGKKHGRKNIRKVMGKNQLEEATKKAAREEKERIARIAERQKTYNNLEFDESGKPDEVVLDKVVLDFDPETKEPLIELDRGLVKKLKPHQANGIKFMWDACFESVKRIKKDRGSGCILAHCMGLGKTLQVVSLTHTLLTHSDLTGVNRVLVVCPLSTVLNWVNEFSMWLKHAHRDFDVDVYELSRHKQNSERAFHLSQWYTHGGVCVLGYEMFRNLSADNNKKFKKKMLRNFQESLVDPGPDLVVCDEGHLLKNEKTSLSQSMNRVKTHRRIVLTGTPLQNNLKEYYCMVQFVKPNLLGKYNEYLNRFVNPITNGQYTDSTEHDIRIMKRRSHVLHKMLDGAVQRRDYGVLAPFLPPKHEYVLFITLSEVQIKLYQTYLDNYSRRPQPGKSSGFLFPDFQSLQRIWTHPLVLKYNSERYEIMQQKKRDKEEEDSEGSLADFIDDDSTPDESSTEESSDDMSDVSDDSRKKSKKKKSSKKGKSKDSKASTRRGTRANPSEIEIEDEDMKDPDVLEVKNENPTEWWIPQVTEEELDDVRNSHKLVLLFEILRQCEAIGDKLLVFSQSLYSLDLIEHFLGKIDEATQEGRIDEKLGGHVGSWSPGVDYFRLDGSTSCENRSIWCKNFNREDNPRARLFLISTRAGGLGINLVAANRVVIFDVSWNPSHDVQSIFRVYRFGQKKPCYVYRFLAMGTMEEKIYERQVTKQAISKRVIDEQQIDRHYAENDLAELYKFEPRPPEPRPVPLVPKDRLFAEMLKAHEPLIYKFHEHDSLLENKEEETLSEEERKAAWEDFENEKNKPPPTPFANAWPMHNGMVGNLLAQQQQQQLAYAALVTMLRKESPNISDDQIRSMLPLIYGANPALMQKLSDIYKYPQPGGMMNPGMMNPVMNAGAGGMGGGSASGLQYEPPWAREQQQMRLQQLMQQQNQMGAKYYAGGLGSRDPVAMALQQQRAREFMLGDRGRPRGRPPLQARAPPAASGDVVNLDSD